MAAEKIYVAEFENHIGDLIEGFFMVEQVALYLSKDKNAWVSFILKDKTGRIHAKMWKEHLIEGFDYESLTGKVVSINAMVEVYNGEASLALHRVEEADAENVKVADFMYCLSDEERERYTKKLFEIIESVEDESVKLLLNSIFKYFIKKLCALPAGKSLHHAYNGALLVHTLEVAEIAINTCDMATNYAKAYSMPINRDLVVAGALLHDIGKVVEYESFPGCAITLRGSLVGHLVEGVKCINSFNGMLKERAVPTKTMNVLEHLILSSHGGEGGGLKPSIKEAIIVKNADMMSAEVDAFDTVFWQWDEKHPTNKQNSVKNPFTGGYAMREVLE